MFAAVFIPDFSLQAMLRHEPDLCSKPVALIDPALPKPNIVQLTSAARARGVGQGLTPSQAMARCSELLIKVRSPAQEQAMTDILLQTGYAFAPNIEATAAGVCTLELKGLGLQTDQAAHAWAQQLIQALGQTRLNARVGMASTPALALLAARAASEGRVTRVPELEENGDSDNSSFRVVCVKFSKLEVMIITR
jgi:protein ImuB